MADQTKTKIILRNGTAAQWAAKNPVLLAGEAGIETDTQRVKYGNGTTAWNALEYAAGSKPVTATAWGEVTGTLSNQTDLKTLLDSKESTAQKGAANGYAPLNEAGKVPPVHLALPDSFTPGMILMWSGTLATIPAGWALCDGQSGRPNLLGKFIRGVGTAGTQPGGTGGADSVTLQTKNLPTHIHDIGSHSHTINTSHTHSFSATTSTDGDHTHSVLGARWLYAAATPISYKTANTGSYNVAQNNISSLPDVGYAGQHTHTLSGTTGSGGYAGESGAKSPSCSYTGSGVAFDTRPAFYELAYIIKL